MKKIASFLILLLVTAIFYGHADYQTFNGYGIAFNYLKDYTVESASKGNYDYISLKSKEMRISIQIYSGTLTNDFADKYIKQFNDSLSQSKVQLASSNKKGVKIFLVDYKKDPNQKMTVEGIEYTAVFSSDKIKLKSTLLFFSYLNKGYMMIYTHQANLDKSKDMDVIRKSLTII